MTIGFVRLESHLARMAHSAVALGLAFDQEQATAALAQAVAGMQGPLRVRLTLDEKGAHRANAAPLPANQAHWSYAGFGNPDAEAPINCCATRPIGANFMTAKRRRLGADEIIFRNERGEITEGARSNIFVRRGDILLTPPLSAGVLDGRLRAELIAQGRAREAVLTLGDLSGEVFFGNSLRGLVPAHPATP